MGIKVALEHRTSYTFDRLVEVYPHVVRLRPAPHSRTPIEAYSLQVEPADHFINWQQDAFGNFLARLVFPNRARSLTITVGLIADMKVINPFDFFIEDWAEQISAASNIPKALAEDLKPYLRPVDEAGEGSGPGDLVQAWVKNFSVAPGTRTIDFLVALNRAVNADVGYSLRMEPGVQTPDFTLRTGIGSCRDSAWLLVSILRQLGLAARFVSGYLVQLTSDVEALDGPSGPAADFTDLHAWAEVYIPGAGWIGLDPTSGLFAGEGHIPLSATPHPESAAPITGATEPCETTFDFSNVVTRVHEDPRVTLPYTEAAWGAICALGARVDERLAAGDVRLTVGGEPTFVSIDNQVDSEWTTDADGPHKRERASALAARLKKLWAPQGLVQRSQGKWYPGEPLPRWQIGLFWRIDGQPLWTDEALLADPWQSGAAEAATSNPAPIPSMAPDAGQQVLGAIADGLGLPAAQVRPAYEDALSRLASRGAATRRRTGRRRRRFGGRRVRRPRRASVPPRRARHGAGGVCAAAAPPRGGLGLGQRGLETAPRAHRAARGRFAGRAAAAAEFDQLGAAAADLRPRPADRSGHPGRRNRGRRRRGRGRRCRAHHRHRRRGPRRAALHLPAADRGIGTFRRPDHPRRSGRRRGRLTRGDRRLRTAARSADRLDDDHPRPGRHRGQRGADGQFHRADASSWKPSTSRRAWPGCPPSRSTSTERTAAPAAATTSRWAASRPPIRRCCAAPTCWCRC